MDDAAYQRRSISFQVDGEFVDAFDDIINFVTVNFRKKYSNGQTDVTNQIIINGNDLKKGISLKEIEYPRLGLENSDWLNYEYQTLWSFKGKTKTVRYPADGSQWISSSDPGVSLIPPLIKEYIEVDGDRQQFLSDGIASVNINFASVQGGDKKIIRNIILRAGDPGSTNKVALYHDASAPIIFRETWYSKEKGKSESDMSVLKSNFIFLSPPAADKFSK